MLARPIEGMDVRFGPRKDGAGITGYTAAAGARRPFRKQSGGRLSRRRSRPWRSGDDRPVGDWRPITLAATVESQSGVAGGEHSFSGGRRSAFASERRPGLRIATVSRVSCRARGRSTRLHRLGGPSAGPAPMPGPCGLRLDATAHRPAHELPGPRRGSDVGVRRASAGDSTAWTRTTPSRLGPGLRSSRAWS